MTNEWLQLKRQELERNRNHPEIKMWDIFNFLEIIKRQKKEIKKLQKKLQYHGF